MYMCVYIYIYVNYNNTKASDGSGILAPRFELKRTSYYYYQ